MNKKPASAFAPKLKKEPGSEVHPVAPEKAATRSAANTEMKHIGFSIPKDLHRRIKSTSLIEDKAVKQIVTDAIIEYLDKQEKTHK